jgi:ATP-dependent DNA helicase HFM1/MER3
MYTFNFINFTTFIILSLVIAEVAVQNESHGLLLRNSLEFLSSLKGRSWHSNSNLLQQIPGIGQVGSNSLFNAGIRSIDAIRSADDSRLEILLKRNPPFGRNIKKSINESFPSVNFNCELKNRIIKMSLSLKSKISTSTICFQGKYAHLLVIAYTNSSTCRTLLYDQIPLNILDKTVLNRTVNIENCTIESSFSCSFMFEDWSGLNQNICFDIENLKLDVKETVADLKETLNISSVSEIDLPSDFDFEDNLHFDSSVTLSSRHKDPHPNIPLSPLSTKSQTPSKPIPIITNSSCKHNCKDKFNCAHVCCKAGLLKRPAEIALTPPPQSLKKKSSFLSGAKRSLSNAREYLRKYQPVNITSGQSIISNLQPCTQDKSDLYDEIEIALR